MAINSGPVIVNLCISDPAIKLYSRGIFDMNSECLTDKKHAVTAIGYGEESEKKYLLVKNSWGTSWGLSGFFKIKQGDCGINQQMYSCTPQVAAAEFSFE